MKDTHSPRHTRGKVDRSSGDMRASKARAFFTLKQQESRDKGVLNTLTQAHTTV